VERIFQWRTAGHLGVPEITRRLNADPGSWPPAGGWGVHHVYKILSNPKFTGYMVYGRSKKMRGRPRPLPQDQWLWTPKPAHDAIVTREVWEAAQHAAAEHTTRPDRDGPAPYASRTYVLRSRVRCRACNRRMSGGVRPGAVGETITYYICPHRRENPRHAAKNPDHPISVNVREDALVTAIREGLAERVFGPGRAALLAATYPATHAAQTARRDKETARLRKRLKAIDAFEDAHTGELEALITSDAAPAVITALRTRHIKRFTELEAERAAIDDTLTKLAVPLPDNPGDPALLDALPTMAGALDGAPQRLQQQLYEAFDIQALYHVKDHQVTIRATLTTSTPVAAIIADAAARAASPAGPLSHLSTTG